MKQIKKYNMKTLVVGQIHDSIVADVPDKEFMNYCEIVNDIVVNDLKNKWDSICVPLSAEIEATPVNGAWYEKQDYTLGSKITF